MKNNHLIIFSLCVGKKNKKKNFEMLHNVKRLGEGCLTNA